MLLRIPVILLWSFYSSRISASGRKVIMNQPSPIAPSSSLHVCRDIRIDRNVWRVDWELGIILRKCNLIGDNKDFQPFNITPVVDNSAIRLCLHQRCIPSKAVSGLIPSRPSNAALWSNNPPHHSPPTLKRFLPSTSRRAQWSAEFVQSLLYDRADRPDISST